MQWMVHMMTSHLPASEQAVEQEAAASQKDGEPKASIPKNELISTDKTPIMLPP